MTPGPRVILFAFVTTGALIATFALSQTSEPEGHVTAIFHEVQLLPEQADPRPAAINDKVNNGTALRTGDDSRSELTFGDLTITRLGENTIFSFNRAGRSVRLDSGSILLYVKKNSSGAEVSTKAVTVGISGTTLIVDSTPQDGDNLIVLEGGARMTLKNHLDQSSFIQGGQMLSVPSGATKIQKPTNIRIEELLKTHPLLADLSPLPSQDLMLAVVQGQNAPPLQTETADAGPTRPTKKRSKPQPTPVVGQPVTQTGPSIWTGYPSGTVAYPPSYSPRPGRPGNVRNPPGGYTPRRPTPTPTPRKKRKPGGGNVG
jgi:hypothetical protein